MFDSTSSVIDEVLSIDPSANIFSFFNWDSLHARINSYHKAWSYKKKKHKKIKAYRNSLLKEPTVNKSLLILDFKPLRL